MIALHRTQEFSLAAAGLIVLGVIGCGPATMAKVSAIGLPAYSAVCG